MGIAKIQFQVDEYTRLEEEETLIENRTVFFANQLNFGVKLPWVWTVEIRNFTQIRQKILWYNSRIPALAINELLSTSRR